MITNSVPRLYVSFIPPEGETSAAFRLPVVAFDDQGFALVVATQHAAQPADRLGLVLAATVRTSLGDGWVAWMTQDPEPAPAPVAVGVRVVGVVAGSSAPVEYTRPDGTTGIGIVSAWGVKEDGTMLALGVTEQLARSNRIERDPDDGEIVATHDEWSAP